jgi:hypothetical protein
MLKTWTAFARGVAVWSIQETDGNFLVAGCQSTVAKTSFLPGSTVHDVFERMIAILKGSARK